MYLDGEAAPATTGSASGWEVDADQVRNFVAAVQKVRADLNAISSQVNELSTPNYAPMLGTSPVGQELAEKFTDRMGSENGLRGQLQVALQRMEEFVASAELTARSYESTDQDGAQGMQYS